MAEQPSLIDPCAGEPISNIPLRIGAIFVILITSLLGTLFPIASLRLPFLRQWVPGTFFEFAKQVGFFSSGIILSTGFIHLLSPAADLELGASNTRSRGGCISDGWATYPYAYALCLTSLYVSFVGQMVVKRLGEKKVRKMDQLQRAAGAPAPAQPTPREGSIPRVDVECGEEEVGKMPPVIKEEAGSGISASQDKLDKADVITEPAHSGSEDALAWRDAQEDNSLGAQLLSVFMLEFGIVFHSVIIGLALAVTGKEFTILFVVIVFHQMFEGLGVGTRLAFLRLPPSYAWVPYFGAILYAAVTPFGMIIGLAIRSRLSMNSTAASLASGILDAISAGILIYAAMVELIGNEFIHSKRWMVCSWGKLFYALGSFGAGAGVMSLLGKWA